MNYSLLQVQIISEMQEMFLPTDISVVEFMVEYKNFKKKKKYQFKVIGWGKVGKNIFKNFSKGDSLVLGGFLFFQKKESQREISFTAKKLILP